MGADLTLVASTLLAQAEEALRVAADEPRRAVDLADEVLQAAEVDAESASVAERALGLAARELQDVPAVRRHLVRAIELAEEAGLLQRAAEARLSLAAEYVTIGNPTAALRELGRASQDLVDDHPQIHAQFAFIYTRLGSYDEALVCNNRALASAERLGDTSRMALILANRGIAYGLRGELGPAERDLRRGRALCEELGERFAAVDASHNLAWVLGRAGRVPESLALFDEAEQGLTELGTALGIYRMDRAEVLLSAGLVHEAQALTEEVAQEFAVTGHAAELAEAQLLHARAALLAGDFSSAAAAAAAAAASFDTQERPAWSLVARAVEIQARSAAGEDVTAAAADVVTELAVRGLREDEEDLRLVVGSTDALEPLSRRRRSRSARTRSRAWHAELLLRRDRGDEVGALAAARAALRALDDVRSGLGATDLHASAAVHGKAILRSALELALDGSPERILRWSERARATTLQHAPVRPPDDEVLAADLDKLRSVTALRQRALLDEDPSPALHAEQLALEDAIRRRTRHAQARRNADQVPTSADVRRRLSGARLVSLFEVRGRLLALVLSARHTQVVDVCPEAEVTTELRHLRLALRRAILGQPGGLAAVTASSQQLDRLLAPALDGSGGLVIVPTPALAALPWALLESLAATDVEVTPSLALWCRDAPARSGGARVAVSGPGLAQALGEVEAIAANDPSIRLITGQEATAAAVLTALDGAQLAHLACHGRFRADNPLFSSLLLADGPLTVYDIEQLSTAPEHVVLSACDSARLGEDLLGLAAAFFSLGTRTLIASVVPVDDTATRRLMIALHIQWRAGATPAQALRAAQREMGDPSAGAFVCLTAGQPAGARA